MNLKEAIRVIEGKTNKLAIRLLYVFLGDISKDDYNAKILKLGVFLSFLFMLISVPFNYTVHNNYWINISGGFTALLFFILYLFSRFTFNFNYILTAQFILSLVGVGLGWKFFDGYDGIAFYVLSILTMLYSLLSKGIMSVIMLIIILLFIITLSYIEHINPSIVQNYKNESAKFEDIILTVFLTVIFIFIVIKLVYNKFLEHEGVYRQNLQLEEKNKLIISQNHELASVNHTKDKFFSIISHDLKNPVSNFYLASDLLFKEYDSLDKSEKIEIISMLRESSGELQDLLNKLLLWSRSQQNRIEFNPEPNNINFIILNNISLLKLSANNKNITLEFENNLHRQVYCDGNLINTVVRNLISNAIKFTYQNGSIVIRTFIYQDDNFGLIEVEDNGKGISEENLSKIFTSDNNYQTEGTNKEKGTGLGLILCKEFIEMHDGKIWVESQHGKGTKFSFTIPLI